MKEAPLKGIKIIDASSILMVPYCTRLLADMGAEIIKVETLSGDNTRYIGPSINKGMAAVFLNINRNKKSISVDLKSADGRLIIYKLIKKSDEKKINKLIINSIIDKILLIELINNLLSTLFLSANSVTIELCNGPLIPPNRTKKNPGII